MEDAKQFIMRQLSDMDIKQNGAILFEAIQKRAMRYPYISDNLSAAYKELEGMGIISNGKLTESGYYIVNGIEPATVVDLVAEYLREQIKDMGIRPGEVVPVNVLQKRAITLKSYIRDNLEKAIELLQNQGIISDNKLTEDGYLSINN